MTDTPLSDDVVEHSARALEKTYAADDKRFHGAIKWEIYARAALEAARYGEMVSAIQVLGAMPKGYCFCSKDRVEDDSKRHEPECADLRALLSSIGASQP